MHTENPLSSKQALRFAALWAFAEATVFFIVPDVWLTRLALKNFHLALRACLVATVAAIVGGLVMFSFGRLNSEVATRVLDAVPAISPMMIASVRDQISRQGWTAMLGGPLIGVPYKIYAVETGHLDLSAFGFVAWSIAARLPRFVLLCSIAALIARLFARHARWLGPVHATVWIIFYTIYFSKLGV